jgi:hypothetical protein
VCVRVCVSANVRTYVCMCLLCDCVCLYVRVCDVMCAYVYVCIDVHKSTCELTHKAYTYMDHSPYVRNPG